MLTLWLSAIAAVAKLLPVLIGIITGLITVLAAWFAQSKARARQAALEAAALKAMSTKDTTDLEALLKNR